MSLPLRDRAVVPDVGTAPERASAAAVTRRVGALDVGLLALRLFAGLSLAFAHGINKLPPTPRFVAGVVEMGFPAPQLFAWAAGIAEVGGGLLLVVGLLTRPAAFLILVVMCVAAFIRQAGDPYVEIEPALLFGAVALCFLIGGAGRLSLDAVFRRRSANR
ncbi:MAG TPA: DoxX family protein [Gemmatimonadaceae bacterium]|nr:DoxX family protein [Gemmatimonadaceae bacterium]